MVKRGRGWNRKRKKYDEGNRRSVLEGDKQNMKGRRNSRRME